jgi:HlyD family secretion protein
MNAKISQLENLKIDRNATAGNENPKWIWPLSLVATAALFTVGIWLFVGAEGESPNAAMQIDAAPTQATVVAPPASMLDASGYVVARRQATVSSKIQGRLLDVMIEEGDHVEAGQILARLDNSNAMAALAQAQARVAQGEAALRSAEIALADFEATHERDKGLLAREIISAQQAEATEAEYNTRRMAVLVAAKAVDVDRAILGVANQNLDDTIVRAPFAGIVIAKAAEPGEIVSPNSTGGFTRTGIGTIVDMDSLEVEVDVSESFISRVRPNMPATVRLNAYPDWDIPAQVLAVIPTADRARATVRVRVAFLEKDSRIIPEMGARVSFRENNFEQ